jgi:polyphosphate kinase
MPRNLYERCEAVYPVTAPALRKRLREEILEAYLTDTAKTRFLQENGEYTRPPRGTNPMEAQVKLMELASGPMVPVVEPLTANGAAVKAAGAKRVRATKKTTAENADQEA